MMAWMRTVFELGVKELRSLYRDPVLFGFILFAFTIMVYSAGQSVSMEIRKAPIAIVDEDNSPLSHSIAEAFYPPHFQTPERINIGEANRVLDEGQFTFVLDIPPSFQKDVLTGKQPEIQLLIDATRMSQAFIGAGYIRNIVTQEVNNLLKQFDSDLVVPIDLIVRTRFNPTLTSAWFGGVMELVNLITLLSIILTGAALIREREHGTLEHLLVMPVTPLQIMAAKIWSMALVVILASTLSLYIVIGIWLEMPIAGSVLLFQLGTATFLFSTTSLGILLGTMARSMPQLGLLMILLILPLLMLSGGTTPYESMPGPVQAIMNFAPTSHFVSISQAVLYRGADFTVIWPDLLFNIGLGLVYFLIALRLFRYSLSVE